MASSNTEAMNLRRASLGTWSGQNRLESAQVKCIKRKVEMISIATLKKGLEGKVMGQVIEEEEKPR